VGGKGLGLVRGGRGTEAGRTFLVFGKRKTPASCLEKNMKERTSNGETEWWAKTSLTG